MSPNYSVRCVLAIDKLTRKGFAPVYIVITINRTRAKITTPYKLRKDQWNGEVINYPNAGLINAYLRKQTSAIEKLIIQRQIEGTPTTCHEIRKLFTGKEEKTFVSFANSVRRDQKEINRIINFAGAGLSLSAVDLSFLRLYEAHERARGMSQNTTNTTFKFLRRIMTQAKAEKLVRENPFDEFRMPRYVNPERIYLVKSELDELFKLFNKDLPQGLYATLCYFLLGCYSGLRHSDWGKVERIDGFLKLRTKKNKTDIVLPVGPTLAGILQRLKGLPKPYSNQKCNVYLKAIGELSGVKKVITCHTARHSFGYLCASNKLPKSVTAELMGITVKTVDVYYHLAGFDIMEQAGILLTI